MKVYIIRHGETEYNTQRRYQGITDVPLSEHGLKMLCRADFAPKRVYVSPLTRARQTAAALFPDAEQIPIPELKEMDFGDFEGKTHDEMTNNADYIRWIESGGMAVVPNGECKEQFADRVAAGFQRIVDRELAAGADTIVIVAHGGTQMAVLERFNETGWSYYSGLASYAGGWILEIDGDVWRTSKKGTIAGTVSYLREQ